MAVQKIIINPFLLRSLSNNFKFRPISLDPTTMKQVDDSHANPDGFASDIDSDIFVYTSKNVIYYLV